MQPTVTQRFGQDQYGNPVTIVLTQDFVTGQGGRVEKGHIWAKLSTGENLQHLPDGRFQIDEGPRAGDWFALDEPD